MPGTPVYTNYVLDDAGGTSRSAVPGFTAGRFYIACCINAKGGGGVGTPTCSGGGLTWGDSNTVTFAGGQGRITTFIGTGTPSGASVTFDFAGVLQDWIGFVFLEVPSASSKRNAASAATLLGTSVTANLPALASPDSLCLGLACALDFSMVVGSGFLLIASDTNSNAEMFHEYKVNDTSVDVSWSGTTSGAIIALEIVGGGPLVGMIHIV